MVGIARSQVPLAEQLSMSLFCFLLSQELPAGDNGRRRIAEGHGSGLRMTGDHIMQYHGRWKILSRTRPRWQLMPQASVCAASGVPLVAPSVCCSKKAFRFGVVDPNF